MARTFNGSSDKAQISIDLSGQSKLSIGFWGWNDTNGSGDTMFLEYTATASASSSGGFFIDPNSGGFAGNVELFIRSTTDVANFADKTFAQPSAAAWHHWLIQFDASLTNAARVVAAYIDGVSQSLTDHSTASSSGSLAGLSTLNIMSRGGASLFNAGRMGDLAMWNVLLTQTEASALARGARPHQVRSKSLLFFNPFDGLVSPEPDLSLGGFNATITGTAKSLIGPPTTFFTPRSPAAPAAGITPYVPYNPWPLAAPILAQ